MPQPWILVVDDDPDVRSALCEVLTAARYAVSTAADGREALGIMRTRLPDLVILDLRMPRKSGWEVVNEMQVHPFLAGVPVIVLSADLSMPPAGGNLWLKKPVLPAVLLRNIDSLLHPPTVGLA